ncbi:MAG: hypothetical protein ABSA97_03895 [Verrucomicrobiia bacterium]
MLANHTEKQGSEASLRRTRDLLLPKLVSGEMDVSALDVETGSTVNGRLN